MLFEAWRPKSRLARKFRQSLTRGRIPEGDEELFVALKAGTNYVISNSQSHVPVTLKDDGPRIQELHFSGYDNGQGIVSPLLPNPGTGDAGTAGGLRIFPDYLSYEDTVDRRRVNLTTRVWPPVEGVLVFFDLLDIDNQSYNTLPLDDETQEDDNLGDGSLSTPYAVTNSNGYASVVLTVSSFPLDNFIAVASTDAAYLASLRNVDANLDRHAVYQYQNGVRGPATAATQTTQTLQQWRILHVEVDSMGDPPPGMDWGEFDEPPPEGTIFDSGVPDPDISAFHEAFAKAGVTVKRDHMISAAGLEFHREFDGPQATLDYFAQHRQGRTKDGFFSVYVASAYERGWEPETGNSPDMSDNDPDSEAAAAAGNMTPADPRYAIVCWEILRDVAKQHEWTQAEWDHAWRAIALHEVGHFFIPLPHNPNPVGGNPPDLMWAPSNDAEEDWMPTMNLFFDEFNLGRIKLKLGMRPF